MNKFTAIGLFLLTGFATSTFAQSDANVQSIERGLLPNQFLEGYLKTRSIPEVMLEDNIPGLSMTFVDNGQIAWQKTYGYSDLSTLTPTTTDTVFAGASLSKPLAAVTALQYVEDGKISLDDDINRFLISWKVPDSEFTEKQKVTLRYLIGHQAGVSSDVPSPYDVGEKLPTVTQMLEGSPPSTAPKSTLFATPGEQYKYSNPGYAIIQQLIEDVSGQSFEATTQSAIFDPLDMSSSSFSQPIPERLMAHRASGYNEKLTAYPYQLFPFKGAGGVWTTPTDLATFVMTLINDYHTSEGALISQQIAQQVFARNPTRLGFKKHFIEGSEDIVFDHWGSIPGFTSYMVGSLKNKQALVIMTNSDNGFDLMAAIARTVAQHYDWQPVQPKMYKRHELTPQQPEKFTGTFGKASGNENQYVFEVKNGQLHVVSDAEDSPAPLIAVGEHKFIDTVKNTTFEFLTNNEGKVSWLRVTLESGYNFDQPRQ